MRANLFFIFCIVSTGAFSQGQPRESLDSKVTEVWDPKPKTVSAGALAGEAPSDALILFDGKNLSQWSAPNGTDAKWDIKDGAMTVVKGTGEIKTKQLFGDVQLHIEWRTPAQAEGQGQDRGNSGIFLQDRYELQVLDSYENQTYSNGMAGSIYKQSIPLVNACRKPGEWQSYDVFYTAPRFSDNGRTITPAYMTVMQNGVLIQNHTQVLGTTENKGLPVYQSHGKAPLKLQDHGNPVSYRNIWIREL